MKVCILDYGSGNVKSVYNLITFLGFNTIISNQVSDIESASHIILPGVGSFGSSINKIKSIIPLAKLETEVVNYNKPFLGICVGMQVLADRGFEHGSHHGLGWIKGSVEKLEVFDYEK